MFRGLANCVNRACAVIGSKHLKVCYGSLWRDNLPKKINNKCIKLAKQDKSNTSDILLQSEERMTNLSIMLYEKNNPTILKVF